VSELPTGGATGGRSASRGSRTRVRESKLLIHELSPQSEFFFEPWLASCRHNLAGDLRAQLPYAAPPRIIFRLAALCVRCPRAPIMPELSRQSPSRRCVPAGKAAREDLAITPAASACASGISQKRQRLAGRSHGLNLSISAAISSSVALSAVINSCKRPRRKSRSAVSISPATKSSGTRLRAAS
jgi:hypothetical protein